MSDETLYSASNIEYNSKQSRSPGAYNVRAAIQMSAFSPEKFSGPSFETTSGGWKAAVPWCTESRSVGSYTLILCANAL